MMDSVMALILAGWFPHISPSGILFGCILIMVAGLGIAVKWPDKTQKK
jgi:hypothetical protein